MKLVPKSEEEKQKDKVTLYRNCLKAGLSHIGEDIFTDGEEYFRFYPGFRRKVSDIKKIIKDRYEGNKSSFSVQMHDLEDIIPHEVLCVLVNRRVEAILKRRVKEEMSAIGLSTSIPENIYDPDRDNNQYNNEEDPLGLGAYSNFSEYSFSEEKTTEGQSLYQFTEEDDTGY